MRGNAATGWALLVGGLTLHCPDSGLKRPVHAKLDLSRHSRKLQ